MIPKSPKERIPGVSTSSPPSGSISSEARVVVWRPRPITSLTPPTRRSRPGIRALAREDFPTPECPTKTERFPRINAQSSDTSTPSASPSCSFWSIPFLQLSESRSRHGRRSRRKSVPQRRSSAAQDAARSYARRYQTVDSIHFSFSIYL